MSIFINYLSLRICFQYIQKYTTSQISRKIQQIDEIFKDYSNNKKNQQNNRFIYIQKINEKNMFGRQSYQNLISISNKEQYIIIASKFFLIMEQKGSIFSFEIFSQEIQLS
ncbi:unnamed protein product [Paramecium sonneborni]|uniref:Uncharacterized protein n=1 Tax=Paramecium sonneborni TaxID=65129 RepID=A0A8S1QKC4_9CILI|nr:unnamed protein product [Paramecium sonneborni]